MCAHLKHKHYAAISPVPPYSSRIFSRISDSTCTVIPSKASRFLSCARFLSAGTRREESLLISLARLTPIENAKLSTRRLQPTTVVALNTSNRSLTPQEFFDSPQVDRFTSSLPPPSPGVQGVCRRW